MRTIIFLTFFVLSTNLSWSSQASQVKEANDLFKKQKWDQAIDHYMNALEQNQNANIVQYDLGTALYKKGNYNQSIEYLQKALSKKEKDKNFVGNSYYNLGNAFYQKGHSLEENNIDDALKAMQESLSNYDKTLNLNVKDEDASYNHKIVEKEIERLRKKKQQQQQNQQKDQQQQNSQKNKDQQQNQSQQASEQQQKEDQQKNQQQENVGNGRDHSLQDQQQNREGQSQEDLEKKQAKEMLNDYEHNEAPKGLLNFNKRDQGEAHVDRDW